MSDVTTPIATLSYPVLFNPKPQNEGGEPVYSACLIFEDGIDLTPIKKAIQAAAMEKFGDKAKAMMQSGQLRNPLRDGSEKEGKSGFGAGKHFFNCKTKMRPPLIDKAHNDILDQEAVYAGCQVRASVRFYGYDRNGNKGVGVALNAIQKVGEGERLAGGVDLKNAFGAPPADSGADDDMWD